MSFLAEGQPKNLVNEVCSLQQQECSCYSFSPSLISYASLFKYLILPFTNKLCGIILFCSHELWRLINVLKQLQNWELNLPPFNPLTKWFHIFQRLKITSCRSCDYTRSAQYLVHCHDLKRPVKGPSSFLSSLHNIITVFYIQTITQHRIIFNYLWEVLLITLISINAAHTSSLQA